MTSRIFPQLDSVSEVLEQRRRDSSPDIETSVKRIISDIRCGGETAVRAWSEKLDGCSTSETIYFGRAQLKDAEARLETETRNRLESTSSRIRRFAEAQRDCLTDLDIPIPGGRAGHHVRPLNNVGCYVPGGRYQLVSTVLMTVIPARVAGVRSIWIATPRPSLLLMAAASIAGADGVLKAGGAQGIAALAFGIAPVPPSDIVVGPGNKYVTEAKRQLSGEINIDMLAGPSELMIIADKSADPALVAADLLAQAEHDTDAIPLLISLDKNLIDQVEHHLLDQVSVLPEAETAVTALRNGGAIEVESFYEASQIANQFAPEHLQLSLENPECIQPSLAEFGSLFIGESSGEVFGDYGVGPNHVLPTAGSARTTGGLSVFTFLRQQTWLKLNPLDEAFDHIVSEIAWFARQENLEAHARSAELRSFHPGVSNR